MLLLMLMHAAHTGTQTELHVPDNNGKTDDVVLGFDDAASYVNDNPFFGAVVGKLPGLAPAVVSSQD